MRTFGPRTLRRGNRASDHRVRPARVGVTFYDIVSPWHEKLRDGREGLVSVSFSLALSLNLTSFEVGLTNIAR